MKEGDCEIHDDDYECFLADQKDGHITGEACKMPQEPVDSVINLFAGMLFFCLLMMAGLYVWRVWLSVGGKT